MRRRRTSTRGAISESNGGGTKRDEQPALGYQVRKSSLSIPSNVAEGFSRHSTAFYVQHLWTAHASGAELETQLINGLVRSLERGR